MQQWIARGKGEEVVELLLGWQTKMEEEIVVWCRMANRSRSFSWSRRSSRNSITKVCHASNYVDEAEYSTRISRSVGDVVRGCMRGLGMQGCRDWEADRGRKSKGMGRRYVDSNVWHLRHENAFQYYLQIYPSLKTAWMSSLRLQIKIFSIRKRQVRTSQAEQTIPILIAFLFVEISRYPTSHMTPAHRFRHTRHPSRLCTLLYT